MEHQRGRKLTHWWMGVYFPVMAFRHSCATTPPMKPVIPTRLPCEVKLSCRRSFSSSLST